MSQMEQQIFERPNLFGIRHIQVCLLFFSYCCSHINRTNIFACIDDMSRDMNWSSLSQTLVLSSYLWGFAIVQIRGSLLAKSLGPQLILGWVLTFSGLASFLHPWAASISWIMLLILRFLDGMFNGFTNACVHFLLAKWMPRSEKSFLATLAFSGIQFGSIYVTLTSGPLAASALQWPSVFYLTGCLTLAAGILVRRFVVETPALHPFISIDEQMYIERTNDSSPNSQEMDVPWRLIFSSRAFWGFIAAHISYSWGLNLLLSHINTFMINVLHFEKTDHSQLVILPYSFMLIMGLSISPIADWLINRNYVSTTTARKLFNTLGQCIPMMCIIILGFLKPDQQVLALVLITLGVGFSSTCAFSVLVNDIDLAPNYAGILASLATAMGNILSNFLTLLVAMVVKNESSPYQWRIVFLFSGGICLICSALFVNYGKGTVQSWNEGKY